MQNSFAVVAMGHVLSKGARSTEQYQQIIHSKEMIFQAQALFSLKNRNF